MKKKAIRIVAVILLVLLGLLVAIPIFLESRIGDLIRSNVNDNINGTFDFADADLSLIRNFPNAALSLKDISLVTREPFEGDTLFTSAKVSLAMGLGELLKASGEPISIKSLDIDRARLNIRIDERENANYDIGREEDTTAAEPAAEGFRFDLQSYSLTDSDLHYDDRASGISLQLLGIDHRGAGDLSLEKSELETTTDALVTLEMDSTNYLNRNKVHLDAVIGIDLTRNRYTFLKNEAQINQLPLVFDGFVQLNEENQEVDLRFNTPSSDFRNFLAVFPEAYTKDIAQVQTSGNFTVKGEAAGVVDDTHIPKFNIQVLAENASFKYPELPKSVRNIDLDARIINTTGITDDTFVEILKATFMIDEDRFSMTANITELTGNTNVEAELRGTMNLANLSQAYPIPTDLDLKGVLNADVRTAFDMAAVEKKQYDKTKTNGQLSLRNFEYSAAELPEPVSINTARIEFNPTRVNLRELSGGTGQTDFSANGTMDNLLGFLFNDEMVEGNFNLNSNTFVLNDFMVNESGETEAGGEAAAADTSPGPDSRIRIPAFLDCRINAAAGTVVYDNLRLRDVKADLVIRDEKAILNNLTSSLFDGTLALNGEVSTKAEQPVFAMKLGIRSFEIGETFKALDLFQALAPIAGALEGKLNSEIEISGLLHADFTPDLLSLNGDVLAELLAADLSPGKAELLNALDSRLDFINLGNLDLKGLKTSLSFDNGQVNIKPFSLNYRDIAIEVNGGHTFDRKLAYQATIQVPAKYLGQEVNNLIARIDDEQLQALTIPVTASIGGQYTDPTVSTDLSSGVTRLTARLVEIQKQKMIGQGKEKARELLGEVLSGKKNDSVARQDSTRSDAGKIIGGVLGQKKDTTAGKTDSAAVKKDPVKETARDILGGILGKKKKDTVN